MKKTTKGFNISNDTPELHTKLMWYNFSVEERGLEPWYRITHSSIGTSIEVKLTPDQEKAIYEYLKEKHNDKQDSGRASPTPPPGPQDSP